MQNCYERVECARQCSSYLAREVGKPFIHILLWGIQCFLQGWGELLMQPAPIHLVPSLQLTCNKCSVGLHKTPTPSFLQHQVGLISSDQSRCTHLAALTLLLSHHKGLMNIFCLQLFLPWSRQQVWAECPGRECAASEAQAKQPALGQKSVQAFGNSLALKYCFFHIFGPMFLSLI